MKLRIRLVPKAKARRETSASSSNSREGQATGAGGASSSTQAAGGIRVGPAPWRRRFSEVRARWPKVRPGTLRFVERMKQRSSVWRTCKTVDQAHDLLRLVASAEEGLRQEAEAKHRVLAREHASYVAAHAAYCTAESKYAAALTTLTRKMDRRRLVQVRVCDLGGDPWVGVPERTKTKEIRIWGDVESVGSEDAGQQVGQERAGPDGVGQ